MEKKKKGKKEGKRKMKEKKEKEIKQARPIFKKPHGPLEAAAAAAAAAADPTIIRAGVSTAVYPHREPLPFVFTGECLLFCHIPHSTKHDLVN
mmetsp:Transcript_41833/g.84523  ORF Transcript_41833/g.84523 Transcript_41833/m.84523 type:complete len:93 (-) Transcript_41833:190-468(-)